MGDVQIEIPAGRHRRHLAPACPVVMTDAEVAGTVAQ